MAPECWSPGARSPEVLSHSAAPRVAPAFPARAPPSDARGVSAGSHEETEFAAVVTDVVRSLALAASHAAAAPDEERAAEAPDVGVAVAPGVGAPDAEAPDGEAAAPDVGAPVLDVAALAQVSAEPERQDVRALPSSVLGRLEQLERASHSATAPPRRSDCTRP